MSQEAVGVGQGGSERRWAKGLCSQANLCECCSQRGLMKCIQGNTTMWVRSHTRSRKWGADPRSLCSRRKLIGRTGGIVRDETLSGRAWRTLSLHVSHLAHFIFLTCKHSCPILTAKLFRELRKEEGVTTAIQFPYEQLPSRQGWQFIYFNLTESENHAQRSRQPSHCIQGTRHRRGIDGPGPFQQDPAALA